VSFAHQGGPSSDQIERAKLKTIFLAALLPALATAAQASAASEWVQQPRPADFAAVYPPVAANLALSGDATIHCRVNRAGRLRACKLEQETPAGYGFGVAALTLAGYFRMAPQGAESEISVPIHFPMGDHPAPVVAQTPAPSPPLPAEPNWAVHPTSADYAAVYPSVAANLELAGAVVLRCTADGEGRLRGCKVQDESPRGYGFGDAALTLAAYFRLTSGASEVTFPVRFSMPKR
jgi:protein TonB